MEQEQRIEEAAQNAAHTGTFGLKNSKGEWLCGGKRLAFTMSLLCAQTNFEMNLQPEDKEAGLAQWNFTKDLESVSIQATRN